MYSLYVFSSFLFLMCVLQLGYRSDGRATMLNLINILFYVHVLNIYRFAIVFFAVEFCFHFVMMRAKNE